jgi:predicted permease
MSPIQYQKALDLPDFSAIGAASIGKFWNVSRSGQPALVPGRPVDRGFLRTLGIDLTLGRNFTLEEDQPHGPAVAIISQKLWRDLFGGSLNAVGEVIDLDGKSATVVGVLPASFQFGDPNDVLVPLALSAPSHDRGNHLTVVARLAKGFGLDRASSDLQARMYSHADELRLKPSDHVVFSVRSLRSELAGTARSVVYMFFAFAVCLLALAGANLSNLLLLRSMARRHELAVRSALGADRFRLGLPSLAEGLLVSVFGCSIGLLLAMNTLSLFGKFIPPDWMNSVRGPHLGAHAVLFSVILSVSVPVIGAAVLFRRYDEGSLAAVLSEGIRTGWSRSLRRTGRLLLILQMCFATALIVIAITFSTSLARLSKVELGFHPGSVVTFAMNPLATRYPDASGVQTFVRTIVDRLRETPNVKSVVASTNLPMGPPFAVPLKLPDGETHFIQYRPVTAGYFDVFGILRRAGRDFDQFDRRGSQSVTIVNTAFAERYFHGAALGQQVDLGITPNNGPMRIVGIVDNVHQSGPQFPPQPTVYVPLAQVTDNLLQDMRQFLAIHFSLIFNGDPALAESRIRMVAADATPDQAITDFARLTDVVMRFTAPQRLDLRLVAVLSLLAMVLANVGLYSVTSVSIASRKRDLGVQSAMGATPRQLLVRLLAEVMQQILAGLCIGLVGGWLASRYLKTLVPGLAIANVHELSVPICVLVVVGTVVCLEPAIRGARVNPAEVLKQQ